MLLYSDDRGSRDYLTIASSTEGDKTLGVAPLPKLMQQSGGDARTSDALSTCRHPTRVAASLYACLRVFVYVCELCACQSQSERECVATLPETVSKSVVISEEFTVGCLPVVGAGGSY